MATVAGKKRPSAGLKKNKNKSARKSKLAKRTVAKRSPKGRPSRDDFTAPKLGDVNQRSDMGGLAGAKRDVLFAPWRNTYIKRTHTEEKGCPFCGALKLGVCFESLIVYKGKTCSVILNKFPYNTGHAMVIPHRHTAEYELLGTAEFTELHGLVKMTFEILKQVYVPQGMNIGMNLGRSGGAGIVDHLHYHLVPRWGGDTNFMPIIGQTKVMSESLEETYKKLVPYFV